MKKLILSLLIIGQYMMGQTFEKDLKAVYDEFANPKRIAFDIRYVLGSTHAPGSKIINESNGKYIKSDRSYLSSFEKKSTLVTATEVVVIDDEQKRLRVKKLREPLIDKADFMTQLKE